MDLNGQVSEGAKLGMERREAQGAEWRARLRAARFVSLSQ